jgi:cytochrome c-type biogenesis protein CcmE
VIVLRKQHKQRLAMVLIIVIGIGTAVALALTAFGENMMYFFSPSEVAAGKAPTDRLIRLGGMVSKNSVQRATDSLLVKFTVTDFAQTIQVQYTGILPDLFREGQGVIAIGKMQTDGSFLAQEVLAKHDENYMPPEVAMALKEAEAANSTVKKSSP